MIPKVIASIVERLAARGLQLIALRIEAALESELTTLRSELWRQIVEMEQTHADATTLTAGLRRVLDNSANLAELALEVKGLSIREAIAPKVINGQPVSPPAKRKRGRPPKRNGNSKSTAALFAVNAASNETVSEESQK